MRQTVGANELRTDRYSSEIYFCSIGSGMSVLRHSGRDTHTEMKLSSGAVIKDINA